MASTPRRVQPGRGYNVGFQTNKVPGASSGLASLQGFLKGGGGSSGGGGTSARRSSGRKSSSKGRSSSSRGRASSSRRSSSSSRKSSSSRSYSSGGGGGNAIAQASGGIPAAMIDPNTGQPTTGQPATVNDQTSRQSFMDFLNQQSNPAGVTQLNTGDSADYYNNPSRDANFNAVNAGSDVGVGMPVNAAAQGVQQDMSGANVVTNPGVAQAAGLQTGDATPYGTVGMANPQVPADQQVLQTPGVSPDTASNDTGTSQYSPDQLSALNAGMMGPVPSAVVNPAQAGAAPLGGGLNDMWSQQGSQQQPSPILGGDMGQPSQGGEQGGQMSPLLMPTGDQTPPGAVAGAPGIGAQGSPWAPNPALQQFGDLGAPGIQGLQGNAQGSQSPNLQGSLMSPDTQDQNIAATSPIGPGQDAPDINQLAGIDTGTYSPYSHLTPAQIDDMIAQQNQQMQQQAPPPPLPPEPTPEPDIQPQATPWDQGGGGGGWMPADQGGGGDWQGVSGDAGGGNQGAPVGDQGYAQGPAQQQQQGGGGYFDEYGNYIGDPNQPAPQGDSGSGWSH